MRRWLWISAIVASGCALAPPPAQPLYTERATCAFGVPDGAYALVLASGVEQVTGTFSQGRKNGVFTIFHSSGEKVAELPYRLDALDGTVRLWFTNAVGGNARKLEARDVAGVLDGEKLSWYSDGTRRSVLRYADGRLDDAEAWERDGDALSPAQAEALAETPAGEQLLNAVPEGYHVAYQATKGALRHVEMVPAGETEKDWSEMFTTQVFEGGIPQASPQAFYESLRARWSSACPKPGGQMIRAGEENGYPFTLFVLTCAENPKTSKPEVTFFKAIQGKDSFYVAQKAWRGHPEKSSAERWTRFLREVLVCDTREPDTHPCPKGVSAGPEVR